MISRNTLKQFKEIRTSIATERPNWNGDVATSHFELAAEIYLGARKLDFWKQSFILVLERADESSW